MMRTPRIGCLILFLAGSTLAAETVSPGATAARKRAARQAVAKALERARGLSEVEFEMEKAALAEATKHALVPGGLHRIHPPTRQGQPRQRQLNRLPLPVGDSM